MTKSTLYACTPMYIRIALYFSIRGADSSGEFEQNIVCVPKNTMQRYTFSLKYRKAGKKILGKHLKSHRQIGLPESQRMRCFISCPPQWLSLAYRKPAEAYRASPPGFPLSTNSPTQGSPILSARSLVALIRRLAIPCLRYSGSTARESRYSSPACVSSSMPEWFLPMCYIAISMKARRSSCNLEPS